jgi:multiple sugar transport system substrate-binding protein
MSRRSLLSLAGTSAVALLAAACAPTPPPAPTAKPADAKPTEAPKPAAPAATTAPAAPAAAPAATSAPAAAKPTEAAAAKPATAAGGDIRAKWEADLPKGPVEVVFWHGTDATTNKLYTETFIADYKKLRPNYTIKEEVVPSLDQKVLVALATDTAPDMFTLNAGTVQTFMAKKALSPVPAAAWGTSTIDEMLSKYYLPNVMKILMTDGSLYAIPNQMNANSMMINIRLFKEAGLDVDKDYPKTWNDVITLNQKLTKKDGNRITQKGFEFLWARPDQVSSALQLVMRQCGADILKDGVEPVFNSEAGVKGMTLFRDIAVDPKVTQTSPTSPVQDFALEQNVMHQMGPNGGTFTEFVNPKMKGNYVFKPLPQATPDKPLTVVTAFSLVVNGKASDDKQKVAHDFIQFMGMQPEVWLKATGQLTPLQSLKTSPTAKEIMPFIDVAIDDLLIAQPSVRTEFAGQLDTVLQAAAERVVYDKMDPKQSLDQAAAEFTQAIKK